MARQGSLRVPGGPMKTHHRSDRPDVLNLMPLIEQGGVVHVERQSISIPCEPRVFPDFGKGNCIYCGEPLPPLRRKYCCDVHGTQYRIDTHPYHVFWWDEFRRAIIKRDDFKCQKCSRQRLFGDGPRKGEVWPLCDDYEVHHILPLHCGGDEFDPENCITYCMECHIEQHRFRKLEGTGIHQTRLEEIP